MKNSGKKNFPILILGFIWICVPLFLFPWVKETAATCRDLSLRHRLAWERRVWMAIDTGMGKNSNTEKEILSQGRRLKSILKALLHTYLSSFFLMQPLMTTDQMIWPRAAVPTPSFITNVSAICTRKQHWLHHKGYIDFYWWFTPQMSCGGRRIRSESPRRQRLPHRQTQMQHHWFYVTGTWSHWQQNRNEYPSGPPPRTTNLQARTTGAPHSPCLLAAPAQECQKQSCTRDDSPRSMLILNDTDI